MLVFLKENDCPSRGSSRINSWPEKKSHQGEYLARWGLFSQWKTIHLACSRQDTTRKIAKTFDRMHFGPEYGAEAGPWGFFSQGKTTVGPEDPLGLHPGLRKSHHTGTLGQNAEREPAPVASFPKRKRQPDQKILSE